MALTLYNPHTHPNLLKKHQELTGDTSLPTHTYVFSTGYFCLKRLNKSTVKLEWIYGPGVGKRLMGYVFKIARSLGASKLQLNVSIDPTEEKASVMRRINYYIGFQFRVYDIVFRPKFGPLLKMWKPL